MPGRWQHGQDKWNPLWGQGPCPEKPGGHCPGDRGGFGGGWLKRVLTGEGVDGGREV